MTELTGINVRAPDHAIHATTEMKQVENNEMSTTSTEYQTRFDRENGISSIIGTPSGDASTQKLVHGIPFSGLKRYDESPSSR
jgi:hypothetical protein